MKRLFTIVIGLAVIVSAVGVYRGARYAGYAAETHVR